MKKLRRIQQAYNKQKLLVQAINDGEKMRSAIREITANGMQFNINSKRGIAGRHAITVYLC